MYDIRMEKTLEAIHDYLENNLPSDVCRNCPALKSVANVLMAMKAENNEQIAAELGILNNKRLECPRFNPRRTR